MNSISRFNFSIPGQTLPVRSPQPGDRVILGMSGGVDSSVCAYILKQQGFKVLGLFMKNWDDSDDEHCTAKEDFLDVQRVCAKLGIEYTSIEFIDEYRNRVFSKFLEEYNRGYTPNPDILCNREIKFAEFFNKAIEYGADWIATGHYCQNWVDESGQFQLVKGEDPNKDQTYFLAAIEHEKLNRVLFPIGHLQKSQVREIALSLGLATAAKKDSTGICFIGERKFKEFLSQYVPSKPGFFRLLDGTPVGKHTGSAFYTIGQRKGLSLGGQGSPWFVVDKDSSTNTVYVERGEDPKQLYSSVLYARELSWLTSSPPKLFEPVFAKSRYRQPDQACKIVSQDEVEIKVEFDKPQRALTPGQYIVFYLQDRCLGGGIIDRVERSFKKQQPA